MTAPYRAPVLARLLGEVNRLWPQRSKASDGWIGNAAHRARKSDHNPNKRGSVNAIDITAKGIDADRIVRAAIAHPSTAYVIYAGSIWSRTHAWKRRPYTGSNPHHTHVHISIQQTKAAETDDTVWLRPLAIKVRGVQYGARSADVKLYQSRLRAFLDDPTRLGVNGVKAFNPNGATGYYGDETVALTKAAFQVLANETKNKAWLKFDAKKPGRSILSALGLIL